MQSELHTSEFICAESSCNYLWRSKRAVTCVKRSSQNFEKMKKPSFPGWRVESATRKGWRSRSRTNLARISLQGYQRYTVAGCYTNGLLSPRNTKGKKKDAKAATGIMPISREEKVSVMAYRGVEHNTPVYLVLGLLLREEGPTSRDINK